MTRWLETDTLANQDISLEVVVGSYTATADRTINCQLFADQVAGGGTYTAYMMVQINGAGSQYGIYPRPPVVLGGVTSFMVQFDPVLVRSGDIVTIRLSGLGADVATPDTIVRWFEMAALRPTTADRTADVDADGGVEVGSFQAGAITAAAFAAASIGAPVIADGAIDAATFAAGAIDAAAIANGAIDAATFSAGAILALSNGLAFRGVIASIPGVDGFIVTEWIGFGAGAFMHTIRPYQVYVWRDNGGAGAAPQGEMQPVRTYTTATGQINHGTFSVPLVAGDEVLLLHPRLAEMLSIDQNTTAILLDTGTDGVVVNAASLAADAAQEIATATWVHTSRTITGPVALPGQLPITELPDIVTGVTYTYTLTGMTIPATWARCYLTLKDTPAMDTDAASLAQLIVSTPGVPGTDGLSVLNRAPGVLANGTLVVDQVAGTVAISITAVATVAMVPTETIYFDVKFITAAGGSDRQAYGVVSVVPGITRATA